jgi:hypothetical protein
VLIGVLSLALSLPPQNLKNMNKNFFAGLFIGLGLLAIVAFRPAAAAQKWEYKVFNSVPPKWEATLNADGQAGWEFVGVEGLYVILKRSIE